MTRILLADLSCRKHRSTYTVALRPQYGERVSFQCDGNLGQIMSGLSVLFDAVRVMRSGGAMKPPDVLRGRINLDLFRIEPFLMGPFVWRLNMASGEFGYAANLDRDLEGVVMAFMGAMKFFSFKFGLTTLDTELVRNRDRAGEAGLLTREDFHA